MLYALFCFHVAESLRGTNLRFQINGRAAMAGVRLAAGVLFFALGTSTVLGQATTGGGGSSPILLPVAFKGDPGYPSKPGSPVIILPGDPGYPAQPWDPVIIFPDGPGEPIYIWPGDPNYPYNPWDPVIIWPGDPDYPTPPFQWGDPIIVFPWDPGYPLYPGDPIVVYPGDPGYPATPGDPRFPPTIVWPGDPGYPFNPSDPIIVLPGDPGYPGGPGGGNPGPGWPGYTGDPTVPGNSVQVPPGIPTPDGRNPYAGVVLASDGFLYGTTTTGGMQGHGVVFRMDTTGHNYTVLHTFHGGDGADPATDFLILDGWLYGTTRRGGDYNSGVLFRIDITGQRSAVLIGGGEAHWLYNPLHQFWFFTGSVPYDGLALGQDGCLYGATTEGGASDTQHVSRGTVFKYDINARSYKVLHNRCMFFKRAAINPEAPTPNRVCW